MANREQMRQEIQAVIDDLMSRIMNRVLIEDPFIKEKHRARKPLYAALVPDEIFKGSHFERRFTTSFGNVWEKLAVVAANAGQGFGTTQYRVDGIVNQERLRRISQVLNDLEHSKKNKQRMKPDWNEELKFILAGKSSKLIPTPVICDVYVENTTSHEKFVFELKAPLPNSDQTKVSKEKLFKLYSMEPLQVNEAFFALPYNPYGRKKDYNWSFPARWFNMREDPVVLIGNEFWEKIGGVGTYQAFIQSVNEMGREYKERIYREFLGIEPTESAFEGELLYVDSSE